MSIPHIGPDARGEDAWAAIECDGAVVIDRLATAETMDRIGSELRPWVERPPAGSDGFEGRCTRRTGVLIARSQSARELVVNPLVLGVTKEILSHATSFQMHVTQVITIGPGEQAQPIHRDQWAFDGYPFTKD